MLDEERKRKGGKHIKGVMPCIRGKEKRRDVTQKEGKWDTKEGRTEVGGVVDK